jgi:hypothetical protein
VEVKIGQLYRRKGKNEFWLLVEKFHNLAGTPMIKLRLTTEPRPGTSGILHMSVHHIPQWLELVA